MKGVCRGKVYGTVTVGERGQVVIPAQLRKMFKVESGDRLVVFAKPEMFGFIPADEFNRFITEISRIATHFKQKKLRRN